MTHLAAGNNNAHSTPELLQLGVLSAGTHTVSFTNRRSVWVWGVSDLLLSTTTIGDGGSSALVNEVLEQLNCFEGNFIQADDTGVFSCVSLGFNEETCHPGFSYYWSEANSPIANPLHYNTPATGGYDISDGCLVTKQFGAAGELTFNVFDQVTDLASMSMDYSSGDGTGVDATVFSRTIYPNLIPDEPLISLAACAALVGCEAYISADYYPRCE